MSDSTIAVLVWVAIAVHIAIGALVKWGRTDRPLLAILNLTVALCVLGYWIPRWYSYLADDITWYATDQLVPLYAILVCALSGLALTGRYRAMLPQWIVFTLDLIVLVAFAIFMMTFSLKRLF